MSVHESLPLVITHDEMGMAHLSPNVLEQHCHSNGRWQPSSLEEWVGGPNVGWQVADKIRANRCEGEAFCKIEKVTKLKTERGTSCWL